MSLFEFPLPYPRSTVYTELGITPDADSQTLRDAQSALIGRLRGECDQVDARIDRVVDSIEGLREAQRALRETAAHDRGDAAAAARRRLAELEEKAVIFDPEYRTLKKRSEEIEARIREINRASLTDPEKRAQYEAEHSPLSLLKVERCSDEGLFDNRLTVALVRREVSAWLADRGEQVFHPTDLTRADFSRDFIPDPVLDGDDP
jgi:chromosome segregation ATPase